MRLSILAVSGLLAGCAVGASEEPRLATTPTLHVADGALMQGNPQLARKIANAILANHPGDVDALTTRGDAYYALSQNAAAAHDYQQVLARAPNNTAALNGMGRLRLGYDPGKAEEFFRKALFSDPRNVKALNNLGIACDMQGRHADAQENYRRAIALDPNNASTQINLGLSLASSGDKAGALEVLEPISSDPELARTLRGNLATALSAAGDKDGADRMRAVDAQTGTDTP